MFDCCCIVVGCYCIKVHIICTREYKLYQGWSTMGFHITKLQYKPYLLLIKQTKNKKIFNKCAVLYIVIFPTFTINKQCLDTTQHD